MCKMKKLLPFQLTDYLFTYNYGIHYYGVLLNNPEGVKFLYNQYIIPYFYDDGSYQEMNYYFLSDNTPVKLDPNKGLPIAIKNDGTVYYYTGTNNVVGGETVSQFIINLITDK